MHCVLDFWPRLDQPRGNQMYQSLRLRSYCLNIYTVAKCLRLSAKCVKTWDDAWTFLHFINVLDQITHSHNTPPQINYSFSVEASSQIDDEMGRFKLYPSYTAMFLSATDKDVGTENIFYSIDSGPLMKLDNRQSVDLSEVNRSNSKRLVRLKIIAEDKLGNRSEREAIFYVDGV